jgi:hypothetical protein
MIWEKLMGLKSQTTEVFGVLVNLGPISPTLDPRLAQQKFGA